MTFKRLSLCSQWLKLQRLIIWPDDFSKEFVGQQEKYTVKATTHKQRNQPNRMNDAGLLVKGKAGNTLDKIRN